VETGKFCGLAQNSALAETCGPYRLITETLEE